MTMNIQHNDKHTVESKLQSDPYSEKNIAVFEKIFGQSYISPGGEESASTFIRSLDLHEGQTVLDVACGAGGPAFLMARYKKGICSGWTFLSVFYITCNPITYNCRKYGVFVHGVDLSPMMIMKANEYLTNQEEKVQQRYVRSNQYKMILTGNIKYY